MKWCYQKKGWGLGNFIMATPSLQLLSKKWKKPVSVYFDNKNIQELYIEANFINILNKKPQNKPFYKIKMPKRKKNESDIEANCRILLKKQINKNKIPNPYIDTIDIDKNIFYKKNNKKYIALFHGCFSKLFKDRKNIENEIRQYIIDKIINNNFNVVLLGNKKDYCNYWIKNNLKNIKYNFLNKLSLRETIGVLNQCDYFISNDTGLYHAAAALKIPGLVLWKQTNFIKNKELFEEITHCINKENDFKKFKKHIDSFLEKINNENSI